MDTIPNCNIMIKIRLYLCAVSIIMGYKNLASMVGARLALRPGRERSGTGRKSFFGGLVI